LSILRPRQDSKNGGPPRVFVLTSELLLTFGLLVWAPKSEGPGTGRIDDLQHSGQEQSEPIPGRTEMVRGAGSEVAPQDRTTASAKHTETTAMAELASELTCRQADERGDATAAFNLAVLLQQRRDYDGAIAAYERSDQRGNVDAAFNLGVLFYEIGELARAEAAWQRAVERGHVQAAANLGFLLHRRGDLVGARLAHLRTGQSPHAEEPGPRSAIAVSGFPGTVARAVPVASLTRRPVTAADSTLSTGSAPSATSIPAVDQTETAYRRADEQGDATAAFNLGVLLQEHRDHAGAIAAYERAQARGDLDAAFNLGIMLYEAGDLDRAEAAWRRAAECGHIQAAANLLFVRDRHRALKGVD